MIKIKIFILFLIFSVNLFAISAIDYNKIIEKSFISTTYNKIKTFKSNINSNKIKIKFQKFNTWINKNDEENNNGKLLLNYQDLLIKIFANNKMVYSVTQKAFLPYGQQIDTYIYKLDLKSSILVIMVQNGNSTNTYPWLIEYTPYIFLIKNKSVLRLENIEEKYFFSLNYFNRITTDERISPHVYPYYNYITILKRIKEPQVISSIENNLFNVSLSTLEKPLKQKKDLKTYNKAFFEKLLPEKPIEKSTLTTYNNIGYYLQKAGANKEAIYLLEKITAKFPKRTVAYYNLGDAYWALGDKAKAKKVYEIYIKQMKQKGKQKRIPKIIKDRILTK